MQESKVVNKFTGKYKGSQAIFKVGEDGKVYLFNSYGEYKPITEKKGWDVESTGEYAKYNIGELEAMKAKLMKKKKRDKEEQEKVHQIQFALNAKRGKFNG